MLTGASGFIGAHCVVQLLEKGYRVRASLRNLARAESLRAIYHENTQFEEERLEFLVLDLNQDQGWTEAAQGCDFVMHVASPVPAQLPRHADELIIPAKGGTLRALKAAHEAGIKRVVLTSSVAAICYGYPPQKTAFTEADWTNLQGHNLSPYIKSKTIAEKAAWDFVKDKDLELVTVNPGGVLGPVLEKDYGTSAEIVKKMMEGALPGFPRIGFPLVDVRDVARMHLLAMETPEAAGQRFICANDYIWFDEIGQVLKTHFPAYARKIPRRKMPSWLVRIFGLFDKEVKSILNELDFRKEVSHQKAAEILKWKPRPNEEAIVATAQSLIKFGIV
ncbi:MAG: aldehyde reductase [Microscillaceae bacterium]|nr:aldehyde reductase [Microscillaceae bacterium]